MAKVAMRRGLKPCGTVGAYWRHRRHGETPCAACEDAYRDYGLARSAARTRAVARLIDLYPEVYEVLFTEELAREQAARAGGASPRRSRTR
jgi:hypothetical protein